MKIYSEKPLSYLEKKGMAPRLVRFLSHSFLLYMEVFMKLSNVYFHTLKDSDENSKNTNILTKCGFIKKIGSGEYDYLPMGNKFLEKIKSVFDNNLVNKSIISNDIDSFNSIINERVRSYKDLPQFLYTESVELNEDLKYRNGLLNNKSTKLYEGYLYEDEDSTLIIDKIDKSLDELEIKYKRVISSDGIKYYALNDVSETEFVVCEKCDYAYDMDVAGKKSINTKDRKRKLKKVATPHAKTIEELCDLLKSDIKKTVKALLMDVDGELVAFFVRGDRGFNTTKAKKLLSAEEIGFASDELIATSNACPGFTGPVNLNCKVIIDNEILEMTNFSVGANEEGYHFIDANLSDFKYDLTGDIADAVDGDICPLCGSKLKVLKGDLIAVVSNVYNDKVTCVGSDNKEKSVIVKNFKIYYEKVLASLLEQYDNKLPINLCLYRIGIIPAIMRDENIIKFCNDLESKLDNCLLDDRDERNGVKFNDMELLGMPIRITVGRDFNDGKVEFKLRDEENGYLVDLDKIEDEIKNIKKKM